MSMTLHEAFIAVGVTLPLHTKSVSDRLNRAYDIVRMSDSEYMLLKTAGADGDHWHITKASGSLVGEDSHYTITPTAGCSCPDAIERAEGGLCKHRLAVRLLEAMGATESMPAVSPAPQAATPVPMAKAPRPKVLYSPEHRIPYHSLAGASTKERMVYPRALDRLYTILAGLPDHYQQNPTRCMNAALLSVSKSHAIAFREVDIGTIATLLVACR